MTRRQPTTNSQREVDAVRNVSAEPHGETKRYYSVPFVSHRHDVRIISLGTRSTWNWNNDGAREPKRINIAIMKVSILKLKRFAIGIFIAIFMEIFYYMKIHPR